MFDAPTTIILGAGASVPYGFPTGDEFKREIVQQVYSVIEGNEHDPFAIASAQLIFDRRSSLKASSEFRSLDHHKDFMKTLKGDRHSPTIDVFLRDHDRFSEIGRFYASLSLLKKTYPISNKGKNLVLNQAILESNSSQHDTDWYAGLIRVLRNGCGSAAELERNNNVTIITFNYDQSLEIYLENFLANTQAHSGAKTENVIDILHVYGKMPRLDLKEKAKGPMNLVELAYENHEDLRIIGERATNDEISRAQAALRSANRIVFVGFGFDQTNLNLLKLPSIMDRVSIRCHVWNGNSASSRKTKDLLRSWRDAKLFASAERFPEDINQMCFETDIAREIEAGLLGVT